MSKLKGLKGLVKPHMKYVPEPEPEPEKPRIVDPSPQPNLEAEPKTLGELSRALSERLDRVAELQERLTYANKHCYWSKAEALAKNIETVKEEVRTLLDLRPYLR